MCAAGEISTPDGAFFVFSCGGSSARGHEVVQEFCTQFVIEYGVKIRSQYFPGPGELVQIRNRTGRGYAADERRCAAPKTDGTDPPAQAMLCVETLHCPGLQAQQDMEQRPGDPCISVIARLYMAAELGIGAKAGKLVRDPLRKVRGDVEKA